MAGNTELKTEEKVSQATEKIEQKMSVGYVGNIEQFSFNDNDLEEYLDRAEQSFLVNKVEETLKVQFLKSTAGKEFNEKVKILLKSRLIKEFKYADLKKILIDHFQPTKNIRAERFKFWSRQMQENESLHDFILEFGNLSSTCEYGSYLDQMLSDKMILSLKDAHIQKKLMDEPIDVSFSKICNSALAMEMIRDEVNDIQHHSTHLNKVTYYGTKGLQHSRRFSRGRNDIKSRLGPKQREDEGNSRNQSTGRFQRNDQNPNRYQKQEGFSRPKFEYKCFECGERGHLQINCPEYGRRNMGRKSFSRVNKVDHHSTSDDDMDHQEDVVKCDISEDDQEMLVGNMNYAWSP